MGTISQDAIDLIVREEISSEAYYNRKYKHFEWPGESSGPTVGIGYDCGYCTKDEIRRDWDGILNADQIAVLVKASGLKKARAKAWVAAHEHDVTITYEQARQQFDEREIKKWIDRVKASLPNTDKLSPDCFGALVSLAYNRGCSFNLTAPRYREMRAIKAAMSTERYDLIPDAIRSMKRLWSPRSGLIKRRDREANLFQRGLKDLVVAPTADIKDLPSRPEHDRPDPKDLPQVPSRAKSAAQSWTVWSIITSFGLWVVSLFQGALDWVLGLFGAAQEILPLVQTDVESGLAPISALAGLLGANIKPLLLGVGGSILLIAIARHVKERNDARRLKAQVETDDEIVATP